jgi:hypothetical protein
MEHFSLRLAEDGRGFWSSHGFLGKPITNEGILVMDQDFRRLT